MIAIWIICAVAAAIYLLMKPPVFSSERSIRQAFIALAFIVLSGYMYTGIGDNSLGELADSFLPPPEKTLRKKGDYATREEMAKQVWIENWEEGQQASQESGKPMMIDFTGYTCVNCRWMEQNIFTRKQVNEKLSENFVLVKLYTDGGEFAKENRDLQINKFGSAALPFYVILKDNRILKKYTGISNSEEEFLDFLTLNQSDI